jgi:hypothetical protein
VLLEKKRLRQTEVSTGDIILSEELTGGIKLNYGIEIECVFDIIDNLSVYISFIHVFFIMNSIKFESPVNLARLDMFTSSFNLVLEELISFIENCNIEDIKELLINNHIYEELKKIYDNNKNYYKLFENYHKEILLLAQRIRTRSTRSTRTTTSISTARAARAVREREIISIPSESSDTKGSDDSISDDSKYNEIVKFINDFTIFIKNVIKAIVKYIKVNPQYYTIFKTHIDRIIELLVIGGDFFNDFDDRFKLNSEENLQIFNENNTDTMGDFYEKSRNNNDKLYLFLTQDCSVICTDKKLYKDIKSGKIELDKFKFLLNECEFITQVFKTPNDIERLLNIFFTNQTVDKNILNCEKTSNHVHISFNIDDTIIKPDIKHIIALLCICHYFQDEIYMLFLKTRSDNYYCAKLNYNPNDTIIRFKDSYTDDDYDKIIEHLFDIFYNSSDKSTIKLNRYFWLNIVNLYKLTGINRPATVEFRIKHGSTDAEEMKMVCILYKNIIDFAIRLSIIITDDSKISNIYHLISSKIEEGDIEEGDTDIKKNFLKILKDTSLIYYFTNPESKYVKGLKDLESLILPTHGGLIKMDTASTKAKINHPNSYVINKKQISESPLVLSQSLSQLYDKLKNQYGIKNDYLIKKIVSLRDTMIYKKNSFGEQFIGYGLSDDAINGLSLYFSTGNDKSIYDPIYTDEEKFNKYLKKHSLSFKEM